MASILYSRPSCPGFDSQRSRNFFQRNVAEVNQWRCSEEIEEWHENVDCALLVLASGMLVVKKIFKKNLVVILPSLSSFSRDAPGVKIGSTSHTGQTNWQ